MHQFSAGSFPGNPVEGEIFTTYPSDPTTALKDIGLYFAQGGDIRYLVRGVYDLGGYGLKLWFGEPDLAQLDPAILCDACSQVKGAIQSNPDRFNALPFWLKPVLMQVLEFILIYIQGRATMQFFATNGMITAIPQTNPVPSNPSAVNDTNPVPG